MTRIARGHLGSGAAFDGVGERLILSGSTGFFFFLVILTACNSLPPGPAPASTVVQATLTTSRPGPQLTSSTPVPSLSASQSISLTIWAPEEFAPEAAQGGQVLQQQIEEFTRAHPNIAVNFVLKSRYGKGGLLDFMTKVQALVPARLPDLVIVDSRELDTGARAGLLQPLDHDLPSGAFADLFPPARALGEFQGDWVGEPITLDMEHLAYNTKAVRTPPTTWDQLLSGGASFAFPADADETFLFQYLENHGRLTVSPPVPLDVAVTTAVLSFYSKARAANLIPDSVFMMKTSREVWQAFVDGQVALAEVAASDFLADHAHVPGANFAPLPTQDGGSTALVSSWNYGIVTSDPARHAAAAEFLNWMIEPDRVASWATAARLVPARRTAFVLAVGPAEYADFLIRMLDAGMAAPSFSERAPYAEGWHTALQSVLRGQATPGEAALKAAQAMGQ